MSNVEFIFCHSGERRNPALNFSGVFIMNTKIECWAPIVIGATEKNKKSRLREPGAASALSAVRRGCIRADGASAR